MSCQKEGEFSATIISAQFIESRFKDGEHEICIDFKDDADQSDGKIYMDLSSEVVQSGNNIGKRQVDITLETLRAFNVDLPTQGANAINNLIHQKISVYGKKNTKGYLHFYLNTRRPDVVANPAAVDQKLQSLFGGQPANPPAQQAPQQTAFDQGGFSQAQPQNGFAQQAAPTQNGTAFQQ